MESQERKPKTLHSKRSFGKHPRLVDYPSYDASEEDNDPLTDDGASTLSMPVSRNNNLHAAANSIMNRSAHPKQPKTKHNLASSILSDSDGVDSPTYDGDIESSATAGPDTMQSSNRHHHHHTSSTSTLNTPLQQLDSATTRTNQSSFISPDVRVTEEAPSAQADTRPSNLTVEDIQGFVQKAIDGETWRKYKINSPPTNRPVRVYADGVYDLFHFGHALQLRQAKLSFPSVHLLVGVCSDELVIKHKAQCVMTHAERCEAARHCRWVDEVVPDAPWVIDEDFLTKHEIDYVAHDEDPYVAEGHEDVYAFTKSLGKFIPTRRTPGVSTSELLERIVTGYRRRDFDKKLEKMGHAELKAEGSDYDGNISSRSASPFKVDDKFLKP